MDPLSAFMISDAACYTPPEPPPVPTLPRIALAALELLPLDWSMAWPLLALLADEETPIGMIPEPVLVPDPARAI